MTENAETTTTTASSHLRWLADNYEQNQRMRIQAGERIRAVIQGRDTDRVDVDEDEIDVDSILKMIVEGSTNGATAYVPAFLTRSYRLHHGEERASYRDMIVAVKDHPAWPWLEKVKGIGPTMACKILSRLDLDRAEYASSFWSYCGLGTVPANKYRCSECGRSRSFPVRYKVTGKHTTPEGAKCPETMELVAGPDDGVRCAQPRPSAGQKSTYDQYAKKTIYLIGTQFLKAKGAYADFYHREREKYDESRPGWDKGRKHLSALRKTEKLFLSHLYEVWCEATGREPAKPWIEEFGSEGHTIIDPWDMVG